MPTKIYPVSGTEKTFRIVLDELTQGWNTRSFPHLIPDQALYQADNVVFNRDGLISKRPGNVLYGGGAGSTGSGSPILAMTRFYPVGAAPQLIVHSGNTLYLGNDGTGAFTPITDIGGNPFGPSPCTFCPMFDPDGNSGPNTSLFIADGANVPRVYSAAAGVANPVATSPIAGSNTLPKGRSGNPITPAYVAAWKYHLVYAGEPTEPSAVYISDALRPERFNGFGLVDSAGSPYIPYFPGGRDGTLGVITGIQTVGPYLVVFYTNGVVSGINTGTYGAYEYEWSIISTSTGCPSPRSIVGYDTFIVFFGNDRFYATDGQSIYPLPDDIPSVYANTAQSVFPCEMQTKNSVVGIRRGQQYWAGYDNVGDGKPRPVAVFDFGANGGWVYGSSIAGGTGQAGGAWSRWPTGMNLGCGIECRGKGDSQQMFWGSSTLDRVAQHDVGTWSDFTVPIVVTIATKAFFLDKPIDSKKTVAVYLNAVFQGEGVAFNPTANLSVIQDASTVVAAPVQFNVPNVAPPAIIQQTRKCYPQVDNISNSFQVMLTETSTHNFGLVSFVVEIILDDPAP